MNSIKLTSIAVLILTRNEEDNLPFLLESVSGWATQICIVDSGSTDKTLEIADHYGATVKFHPWNTYADQFNWGLENMPFTTDWIMRMDADEIVTPELAEEIRQVLPKLESDITGLYVKRRVYFMGRWIRHGAYYPTWLLRVFRKGKAVCENRWMDEHLVLTDGSARRLEYDIIDENRNGLRYFTLKHEAYAQREMMDMLNMRPQAQANEVKRALIGQQDEQKRWLKGNVYARFPLFWRALLYFLYRYIVRLGFLDGPQGLIFHVLQGFWYRFYVDAKIWDYQRQMSLTVSNEHGESA